MEKETTKIFLNTWGAYNNGCVGYGWMNPQKARDFIEQDPERDGGEWFIADIDNYLGVKFDALEYCNVNTIIETIEKLEELEEYKFDEVVALMEYLNTNDVHEALDQHDSYTFYSDIDTYYDCMDELIEIDCNNDFLFRYFDYEAYHRDCDEDISEMSNGVCIAG